MPISLESVTYPSADDTTAIPGHVARPDGPGARPAILILRGVAGPEDGYTEIACQVAAWGYVGILHGWKIRGDDPPDDQVHADLQGLVAYVRSRADVDQRRVAVFGFCRGGVHALMAATAFPVIRVVVVFHGFAFRPARARPGVQPFDLAGKIDVPMLVMHGTEDEQAPLPGMREMEARLKGLEKPCAFRFYEGVRHGFAVRTHPGHDPVAARASFEEARRFLAAHL
jgi:carboxymethylenebutenolidase